MCGGFHIQFDMSKIYWREIGTINCGIGIKILRHMKSGIEIFTKSIKLYRINIIFIFKGAQRAKQIVNYDSE